MADKRKEILERLKDTCQIAKKDLDKQVKVLEKQEAEIKEIKNLISINLGGYSI